jgi:NADH-quinone oxidoreductase subunit L
VLANKGALKAMVMNRIADVFFILGIILIILTFKTADYLIIFSMVNFFSENYISLFFFELKTLDVICFFFFVGAIGKSAQMGLHT